MINIFVSYGYKHCQNRVTTKKETNIMTKIHMKKTEIIDN